MDVVGSVDHQHRRVAVPVARVIVDRAVARNEISADANTDLGLELLVAPLHFRQLLTRQEIDDNLVDKIVDFLLRGLA